MFSYSRCSNLFFPELPGGNGESSGGASESVGLDDDKGIYFTANKFAKSQLEFSCTLPEGPQDPQIYSITGNNFLAIDA